MNNAFSFLQNAVVEEVTSARKASTTTKQYQPNPGILAIRVWKDGAVYPSAALIDKFDLNYRDAVVTVEAIKPKEGDAKILADAVTSAGAAVEADKPKTKKVYNYPNGCGNGFDVIDSEKWAGYKAAGHMLFIAAALKTDAKVDLFSQVTNDETGKPVTTVATQGSSTFGKRTLIPAINKHYGLDLGVEYDTEGNVMTYDKDGKPMKEGGITKTEFVDMLVVDNINGFDICNNFSKDVALFPKVVSRGVDIGKPDYIRREKAIVYGFIPASMLDVKETATDVELADKVPA